MVDEDEIYGLHCDIGRLENEKKHWHTEFINEQEYAHMMEERAEKAEAENAKLQELVRDYDKMLALAANELTQEIVMDFVLNALRIRMYGLGIEVE